VDTTTVAHPAPPTTTNLNARAERALRLFEERGHEIERIAPDVYRVPSQHLRCTYTVEYGVRENCSCPDHEYRGVNCVHILTVGISVAKRRGTTARRLAALEERLAHELMGDEERQELRDRVLRAKRSRVGF
jgi:hypothetical protein